ncbi:MAG: GNAT family N-acetyltransferase [Sedimentisphaerales bacterium]|nr:GNAT family N-acetyltransferase [Sedimentisphaerales bacterium]
MNPDLTIRIAMPEDEAVVLDIIERTGFFRPVEIDIAREVFVEAALKKPGCTYQSYVAILCVEGVSPSVKPISNRGQDARDTEGVSPSVKPISDRGQDARDATVVGWVCFGATPCTLGTFDIYWIAVDPSLQRQGVGKFMLDFAEQEITKQGGRLAVVETSGMKRYEPTQKFYEKNNYCLSAKIPNFYAPEDDKFIYLKTM